MIKILYFSIKLKLLVMLLACNCIIYNAIAQSSFQKYYSITDYDFFNNQNANDNIQVTSDGGYIISGTSDLAVPPGSYRIFLLKLDASGSISWTKIIAQGSQQLQCCFVQTTSDNGYFVGGYINGQGYIVRTDSSANILWSKQLQGINAALAGSQTVDGGFVISGGSGTNYILVKFDFTGNMLWSNAYKLGNGDQWAFSLRLTADSGFVVSGRVSGNGFEDVSLLKTDSLGNVEFAKTYHNSGSIGADIGVDVLQTSDGGYIMAGYSYSNAYHYYVIKTDASGTVQWKKMYARGGRDWASSVRETTDGYVICGYSGGQNGPFDLWTIKTDFLGNADWAKIYSASGVDEIWGCVRPTPDGGFVMTGARSGAGVTQKILVVKTDALGNSGCDEQIAMPTITNPNATVGTTYVTSTPSITVVDVVSTSADIASTSTTKCECIAIASISGTTVLCSGDSSVLTATGGSSYNWSTGDTATTIVVSPLSDTTYYVTVTNGTCSGHDSITITISPPPIASITGTTLICSGNSTTLTATGGANYIWNTGDTTPTITVSPTSDSIYSVTVSNGNCSDPSTIMVTVNPLPVAQAGTNQNVCSGTLVSLIATGGTSYLWDNGVTQGVPFIPSTTTYNVTVTDVNGCTDTDSLSIIVNPVPIAEAGSDTIICIGDSTIISADCNCGYTYQWSTGDTLAALIVSPLSTTTYNVTVTDPNGCTGADSVTITVNPLPIAEAGTDQDVCSGTLVTLSATGGISYQWDNGVTQNTPFTPSATTTYNVTVTGANGCIDTDSIKIIVNTNLNIDLGQDITVCEDSTIILDAGTGNSYQWSTGEITQIINISLTGSYSVTVTSVSSCSGTDSINVTINPKPIAEAGTDQDVCSGTLVTLSATGGISYQWDNGVTQNTPFTPTTTTTYNVTVSNSNGCTEIDSISIIVNPLPTAEAGSNQSICLGSSVSLTATGGTSYIWDNGVTQGQSFSPTTTTTYTVTVSDANGCVNTDSIEIIVGISPIVNLGSDTTICEDSTITLNSGSGIIYNWSTGETSPSIIVSTSGTYSVTVSDAVGCTSTDNIEITQTLKPIVELGDNQKVCEGTTIFLDAGSAPGYTYLWTGGIQNQTINVHTSGTYRVTVSNSCGLVTDTVVITINPLPEVNLGTDITIPKDSTIILDAGITGMTYLWSIGLNSQTIQISPSSSTTIWVIVTDANTCQDSDTITITVIEKPTEDIIIYNIFTPNTDGKNDMFYIENIDKYPKNILTIYNRNGIKVYEKEGYTNEEGWDGKYKGITVPASTYYYTLSLEGNDKIEYKGYITIVK